jgi:sulfhydrogenase subunit delta
MRRTNLKVGIYEFTGCAGDALAILHSEDELVDFFTVVNVSSFLMAKRDNVEEKLDVALIEGSITTEEQKEKLIEIASRSKQVFAIGICACFGGIQSMKLGLGGWEERFKKVYGQDKIPIGKAFESRPIDDFVKVDGYIPGCPIDNQQFFHAFTRIINGNNPELYGFPVCMECKWKENQCLLVKNMLCLGPLTAAGCGGACPSYNIPCVGCWGPYEEANLLAQYHLLLEKGFKAEDIKGRVRNFGGKKIVEYLKQLGEGK